MAMKLMFQRRVHALPIWREAPPNSWDGGRAAISRAAPLACRLPISASTGQPATADVPADTDVGTIHPPHTYRASPHMKILHTADWHLGRSLGSHELLGEQVAAVDEIVNIAADERPDAIVIAGDVYDRSVPSEDAMRAFQDAMMRLREVAPVLAIAGNHDGAGRLGHFAPVLKGAGIHIAAEEFGAVPYACLWDRHGEVRFHLMPFAMPAEARQSLCVQFPDLDPASISDHHGATKARLGTIDRCSGARHVLVGHLFTQADRGPEVSDSERDISVGGSSMVGRSIFDGFDYVALGHLHKPHDVVPGRVRYAGSIGRFSFSEESHRKSVSIVEFDGRGTTSLREVLIPQRIGMLTIQGQFSDVLSKAPVDAEGRASYVRILLEDAVPQFEAFRRLREHYPFLVDVTYMRNEGGAGNAPAIVRPERRDPMEMVRAFCRDRLGDAAPSEEAMALAAGLMDKARDARVEAVAR
jgi:exonuclease SbcD